MNEQGYVHGIYIGKEYIGEGEIKKGEKAGTKFKKYKLLVKQREQDQFPKKIGCASFIKGFDDLDEGCYFTVGYNLSQPMFNEKAQKEIQYKNAYFIKKIEKDEYEEKLGSMSNGVGANNHPQQQAPAPALPPTVDELKVFLEEYTQKQSQDGLTDVDHFLKTWFYNNYSDEYKAVLTFAKENKVDKE